MDVGDWLRNLGLGQYESAFIKNAIDTDVLPELTEGDLEKLEIPLGDRKRLIKAIKALAGGSPGAIITSEVGENALGDDAERRQVTVMFCDVVGLAALSDRLDPEDMWRVSDSYRVCMSKIIDQHHGMIARDVSHDMLAYFGYPHAQEDDAAQAVRAALALVDAVASIRTGVDATLQARIGIATGTVVVREVLIGETRSEQEVLGQTPNLAARLQTLAEPGTVLICPTTHRLAGGYFDYCDLGPRALKGWEEPIVVWQVVRTSGVESRFEALHATGLNVLVGRDEEFELLLRCWQRAKSGEGQVVLLSGEAGIGKSRLAAALLEKLATEPHARLRYFCSSQHTNSALYPIIAQMERAAGLAQGDTPQARLDKLDAVLAQTSTSIEDAALFAEMLSLPNDGRYPALELTPEQRRQRTLNAFVLQAQALTRSNPLLIIFEDAHWADPTSLEVLSRV